MTVRESVHEIVDSLPEDRLNDLLDYLMESPETEAAIQEGLDDIRNGRTIAIEDYRRLRGF